MKKILILVGLVAALAFPVSALLARNGIIPALVPICQMAVAFVGVLCLPKTKHHDEVKKDVANTQMFMNM